VELDGVTNARQTGGLATADGRRVRARAIIRSGELTSLTATGCEQFSALGIATVIDLRAATAVATGPDASCVTDTAAYYNADLPKILPPNEENYLQTLDATEPKLAEIYGQLVDNGLPAIIHCVIGRDRASMMVAIVLLSLGVPQAQVVADFADNQETDVDAAWLDGVLDRVEQAGGIEDYLAGHGVTEQQLTSLRGAALE
jgi:protein-tyrosine phosphatase